MWDKLDHSAFVDQLNSKFRLCPEGADPFEVELSEVSELRADARSEGFSLLFSGPATPALPQGTCRVEHDELGALELFLVPIETGDAGFGYEAVLSRLLPEETP